MPPVTLNRNTRSDFTRHSISDLGKMIAQEIQSDDKSVEDKEKSSSELEEFFRNVLFALDEEVPRPEEMFFPISFISRHPSVRVHTSRHCRILF